jgi:hypothetical protein
MVAAGGRWLRRALTPTQGTGYERWLRVEPSLRPRVRVQLLYSCTLVRNQGQPHFFILRAGSLSPPAQVAQAEFRWLLAAGYW